MHNLAVHRGKGIQEIPGIEAGRQALPPVLDRQFLGRFTEIRVAAIEREHLGVEREPDGVRFIAGQDRHAPQRCF